MTAEGAFKIAVAAGCSYEVFALGTRRTPTISRICRRHRWLECAMLTAFLIHLHRASTEPATPYRT